MAASRPFPCLCTIYGNSGHIFCIDTSVWYGATTTASCTLRLSSQLPWLCTTCGTCYASAWATISVQPANAGTIASGPVCGTASEQLSRPELTTCSLYPFACANAFYRAASHSLTFLLRKHMLTSRCYLGVDSSSQCFLSVGVHRNRELDNTCMRWCFSSPMSLRQKRWKPSSSLSLRNMDFL